MRNKVYRNPKTMNMCSLCFRNFSGSKPFSPTGSEKKSSLKAEYKHLSTGIVIQVRHGDLTCEEVDCIVNAANSSLDHSSGLAGAIVKKGGAIIQNESDNILRNLGKRLEVADVVVTGPGKLPCKYIIHAVGPIWHGGSEGEDIYLEMAVRNCLEKADELKCSSISLPAISSGIFGFPKEKCAELMFNLAISYINEFSGKTSLKEIRFTNFDDKTVNLFEKECDKFNNKSLQKMFKEEKKEEIDQQEKQEINHKLIKEMKEKPMEEKMENMKIEIEANRETKEAKKEEAKIV
jgi:O-acetyl-ADP-ribose deacetylase (regulator of RNase III)